MPIRKRITEPRALKAWYSSEDAKRSLGWLCQSLNEEGEKAGVSGSIEEPLLFLEDVDVCDVDQVHEEVTIEDARANWAAISVACAVFGTTFRINGKKKARAILYPNPKAQHPALKYRHATSPNLEAIAHRLEEIGREIRKLRGGEESLISRLEETSDRLATSSDVIQRRFVGLWRVSQGLEPGLH